MCGNQSPNFSIQTKMNSTSSPTIPNRPHYHLNPTINQIIAIASIKIKLIVERYTIANAPE
jgi:hypothetical protein